MVKLPTISWREAVKAFQRAGWQHDRTRGSHYIMTRPDRAGLLSVPIHDPIKRGTMRKLIKEAGLTVEEFVNLL